MYRLIALDMDGTLLTSDKRISPKTLNILRQVRDSAALCTGRSLSELIPYRDILPMRYAILESGALLYDLIDDVILQEDHIPREAVLEALNAIKGRDIMLQGLSHGISHVDAQQSSQMSRYHMGVYQSLYDETAEHHPDIHDFFLSHLGEFEKMNLYHAVPEERIQTLKMLKGIQASRCFAEISSLELTPPSATKGNGLLALCRYLAVSPAETIAVGDSFNDISMLEEAGLPLVMGNAEPVIHEKAQYVLPDNDHDGCAYAIEHFLLPNLPKVRS